MIFLTVGSTFPFDRLVRAVDDLAGMQRIGQDVVAQIGAGLYEPRHMKFDRFLAKPQYEKRVQEATALIAHAGAGNADKMNGPLIGGIQERHQRGNIARTINSSRSWARAVTMPARWRL